MVGRLARVGITGGIAEGKSTVLHYLREAGYHVASADEAAREQLKLSPVRAAVAAAAGLELGFKANDLRDRIIGDAECRRAVNRVLHPHVLAALALSGADFMEVPLLIEAALQDAFEEIWVVTCGAEEQRRRLVERTGSEALANRILAIQLPTSTKLAFGDVIVRTNQPVRRVKAYTLEAASRAKNLGIANRAK